MSESLVGRGELSEVLLLAGRLAYGFSILGSQEDETVEFGTEGGECILTFLVSGRGDGSELFSLLEHTGGFPLVV